MRHFCMLREIFVHKQIFCCTEGHFWGQEKHSDTWTSYFFVVTVILECKWALFLTRFLDRTRRIPLQKRHLLVLAKHFCMPTCIFLEIFVGHKAFLCSDEGFLKSDRHVWGWRGICVCGRIFLCLDEALLCAERHFCAKAGIFVSRRAF